MKIDGRETEAKRIRFGQMTRMNDHMKKNGNMVRYSYAIAPLWSFWGTKCHSLMLNDNEIVVVSYSNKNMWRMAFGDWIPLISDKEEELRRKCLEGKLSKEELDSLGAERYNVEGIREVRIECRWTSNGIMIFLKNGDVKKYRIHKREKTDEYRSICRKLFHDIYREKGFNCSPVVAFLKK